MKALLDQTEYGGCACASTVVGEDDELWVTNGVNEDTHKFLLSELVEAGLREKLSGMFSEQVVCKIVSECVGDWKEQIDDIRKQATAHHKINVMLQDSVLYDMHPERLITLGEVSQYICTVNDGKHHDLLVNSMPRAQ